MTATRDLTEGELYLAEDLITAVHKAVCAVYEKVAEEPPEDLGRDVVGVLTIQALATILGMYRARCLESGVPSVTCDLACAEQMATAFEIELEAHLKDCGNVACSTPSRFLVEHKRYYRAVLKLRRRVRGPAVPIIP